ncbi:MAG: AarF/ABC1/UbiB kinase family protein [Anaerolineae bacterium]|nr:AarF/ABC1/UbiB kinase family protein [Anaerolineae bacterium]
MGTVAPETTFAAAARKLAMGRLTSHPDRYAELFRVARTYGLHQVAAHLTSFQEEDEDGAPLALDPNDDRPKRLAAALEELGPCFIKLGQLLSTRPDLLPPAYIDALARLQDTITPVPGERVVQIVERELGGPVTEFFQSFDCQPFATASMAQVHRAVLLDGRDVVVKVQRPGVRRRIQADIAVLGEMAALATKYTPFGGRYDLPQMVRELENSLNQELDFRLEADNTQLISRHLADFPRLETPTVYPALMSRRVLTLGFVKGRHLADLSREELGQLDAPAIAKDLLSAYLKQIIIDGIFHCDPHPGNIFITESGTLALLDFGMVGRFDAGQKDNIIVLLLAFSERQGERVADTYLELITIPDGFNRRAFTQDVSALVSRYHDLSGSRMSLGAALLDLTRLASAHRIPIPSAMTLLGKAMLNLDGTIATLSPELDPVQLVREYMLEVMQRRVMAQVSPGRISAWVLDMKHLVEHAPQRTDTILEKLANDELTMRLQIDRVEEAIHGLNRAANRLSLGMIAGSLIIAGGYVLGSRMKSESPRSK